jgi:hypothetical protein
MTRAIRATSFGALLLVLPLLAPSAALAQRRVSEAAYLRAKALQEGKRGGILSHGWHLTKGAVLTGACGFGVGYVLGGPALAANLGVRAAGGGVFFRNFNTERSGLFRPSDRAFAKACIAEIDGHGFKKQLCKLKGVVLSGLEMGAYNAAFLGGLGAIMAGPAGLAANATAGFVGGGIFGVASGLCRAYVAPGVRSFMMNRSLAKAEKTLAKLERDPSNQNLLGKAHEQLGKVLERADRIPVLSAKQTARFDALRERAAMQSGLRGIAATLH